MPHQQYYDYDPRSGAYSDGSGSRGRSSRGAFAGVDRFDSGMEDQTGPGLGDPSFDILEWHPAFQSCQRYFLDHAQYEPGTQAVCALINIRLPHQWLATPITASQSAGSSTSQDRGGASSAFTFNAYSRGSGMNSPRSNRNSQPPIFVSPIPYIRRLVVTGFDKPAILHGFFGDDYQRGILPHVECERRNYLFAAKSGGWRSCKKQYDIGSGHGGDETVPFMKPLSEAKQQELTSAEIAWSNWLAMEDWMVGYVTTRINTGGPSPSCYGSPSLYVVCCDVR